MFMLLVVVLTYPYFILKSVTGCYPSNPFDPFNLQDWVSDMVRVSLSMKAHPNKSHEINTFSVLLILLSDNCIV